MYIKTNIVKLEGNSNLVKLSLQIYFDGEYYYTLLLYIPEKQKRRNNSHTSSTHVDLYYIPHIFYCPVGWDCRIHWLLLCRGVRPPNGYGYDTKQSDGEVPAVLELWGMWSTPSLPSLPGPLWPGVVAPGYDTKQSDGEVPAVLELWGMWSTPSLPSLPGPLWPGVVAPDRALSMD